MKKNRKNVFIMLGLLLEFAFTTLFGGLFGYYLDNRFSTLPKYTIISLIVASLAGIMLFVVILSKAKKVMDDE